MAIDNQFEHYKTEINRIIAELSDELSDRELKLVQEFQNKIQQLKIDNSSSSRNFNLAIKTLNEALNVLEKQLEADAKINPFLKNYLIGINEPTIHLINLLRIEEEKSKVKEEIATTCLEELKAKLSEDVNVNAIHSEELKKVLQNYLDTVSSLKLDDEVSYRGIVGNVKDDLTKAMNELRSISLPSVYSVDKLTPGSSTEIIKLKNNSVDDIAILTDVLKKTPELFQSFQKKLDVEFNKTAQKQADADRPAEIVKIQKHHLEDDLGHYIDDKKKLLDEVKHTKIYKVKTFFSNVFNIPLLEHKIEAAEKLSRHLDRDVPPGSNDNFSKQDIECLTTGKLGDLVKRYSNTAVLPDTFLTAKDKFKTIQKEDESSDSPHV